MYTHELKTIWQQLFALSANANRCCLHQVQIAMDYVFPYVKILCNKITQMPPILLYKWQIFAPQLYKTTCNNNTLSVNDHFY